MEKPRLADKSKESMERLPAWRVAESFTEARDQVRGSEDAMYISENCIAVFDGVSTPKDPRNAAGQTPGQVAIQRMTDFLRSRPDLKAEAAAAAFTDVLKNDEINPVDPPRCVFVAFFPKENRIVRVGDAQFLIDGVGHNPGIAPDKAKAILRKRELETWQRVGISDEELFENDPSRERLRELRVWQSTYENNAEAPDFGYGVVNGREIPDRFIEYISVPPDAKSVVLASDGYPPSALRMTLAESEVALVQVQQIDALGIGDEPSVRMNAPRRGLSATDDRTYVRIQRA